MRPRNDPPTTLRHDVSGVNVPPVATIAAHNSSYRTRAKLRDILHTVDRHNTGSMPRNKFHLCLELAGLPVPDGSSEKKLYGKFIEREVFRYNDFLDSVKYDTAYRHQLTSRWRKEGGLPQPSIRSKALRGSSLTPEPSGAGLVLPHIGKPQSRRSTFSRPAQSRIGSQGGDKGGTRRMREAFRSLDRDQTGTVTIEELQQGLVALDLVPAAPNAALLELFRNCDRDGQGNIDYDVLCTKLQGFEAKGNAMFVPGYRGAGGRASVQG